MEKSLGMQRDWLLRCKIGSSPEWRAITMVSKYRCVQGFVVIEKINSAYKVKAGSTGIVMYDKNATSFARIGFRVRKSYHNILN